jgi:hypothetical protein
MSRPQFQQAPQQIQTGAGQIVNGGLIDFQDNLQRCVCEYATPNQLLAAGYGGQPVPTQAYATLNGQGQGQMYANYPPQLAQGPLAAGPAGSCFSGPPSFFHVNGITYKPVEPDPVARIQADPPAAVAAPAKLDPPGGVGTAGAKMLTEDDLHRTIDARVQRKVESYLSSQRKSHHSSYRAEEVGAPSARAHQDSGSSARSHRAPAEPAVRSAPRKVSSDEALAVQRVKHANASMRAAPAHREPSARSESRGPNW